MDRFVDLTEEESRDLRLMLNTRGWAVLEQKVLPWWLNDIRDNLETARLDSVSRLQGSAEALRNVMNFRTIYTEPNPNPSPDEEEDV